MCIKNETYQMPQTSPSSPSFIMNTPLLSRHWVRLSSAKRKVIRQKSKSQVWSKKQLKTELDLATKTASKNILRPNFGLRLLS